jgi:putative glycerol kinase 5
LLRNAEESASVARSVPDSNGVYFVPAFSGLQAPINDSGAAAGFIGVGASTRAPHLVRALLESIAFRVAQLVGLMREEIPLRCAPHLCADGGVANNDFVAQLVADLTEFTLRRDSTTDHSALGAAFMAGIAAGNLSLFLIKFNFIGYETSMYISRTKTIETFESNKST